MSDRSAAGLSFAPEPRVDAGLLERKLADVGAAAGTPPRLLEALATVVRTGDEAAVVRINPIRFATEHGWAPGPVIDMFLHARKAGLVSMEWQYVCPGCGEIVERLSSLTHAAAHAYCQVCSVAVDADMSDSIEVTFSIAPAVRRSRYHDPWSLDPEEHFTGYRFTQSGVIEDGTPLREHLRRHAVASAYVDAGATQMFDLVAAPGFVWLTSGPALLVDGAAVAERREFAFEYTGARRERLRVKAAAGPMRIAFTNATEDRYALLITNLPGHYQFTMTPFLSGARLLSHQTFRELFGAETIQADEGLAVKRLTLLFTDLRGSTALYDRIGDMKAFELVRTHFGYLRECIAGNDGALVKTIGDAVMASFVEPVDALRAALAMRERIARFNRDAGADLIGLKIGLHAGACLAVTLNERVDYFGQTVNIAARVQGLADAGEIVLTDDVFAAPGAPELLERETLEVSDARLKGVAGDIRVHRISATPPGGGA